MLSRKEARKEKGNKNGIGHKHLTAVGVGLSCLVVVLAALLLTQRHEASSQLLTPPPAGLSATTAETPLSYSPILTWNTDDEAVMYEIEFFTERPAHLSPAKNSEAAVFRTRSVYQNAYNAPLREFAADQLGSKTEPLYWRVRAIDFNGTPYTPYSDLVPLYTSPDIPPMTAPVLTASYGGRRGETLLYPVYTWIGQANAASYEVAIYEVNPEEDPAAEPIETLRSDMAEIYDPQAHYGPTPFYWCVRAFDGEGQPLGEWSQVRSFRTDPADGWQVAVLGDSISHGGGHFSYSPAVFSFSWLHYLDFPAINLSQSGDTSGMTAERFDRDVLPFHPAYLIIMTGSNSLRAGEDTDAVIADLESMRQRCLENGIRPIFATLPAINPDNIDHVFQEPTADDWQERFDAVNAYIRTHTYIDMATAIPTQDGLLPTQYALDGLHPDANGKALMGAYVNSVWPEVKAAADQELEEYESTLQDGAENGAGVLY